jgi:sterol 3beta-glucosyltransferase
MRWPRVNRKSIQETDLSVPHPGSNDDPVPEVTPPPVKPTPSTDPTDPADPGLSRMFSEAALYEKVLTACPSALNDSKFFGTGDQALQRCICGFNTLVGQDLGDAERAISGRLAKLSVHDWSSQIDSSFASTDQVDEEPGEVGTPEDGEEEKPYTPSTLDISQDAPPDEPKLSAEEIVDLLEQEFGALGPPGEEKLLLETDAAFFQDVIILVGPSLGSSVSFL